MSDILPATLAAELPDVASFVEFSPTSLTLDLATRDDADAYGRFERACALLGRIERASPWWIGDVLVQGERRLGETYAQAAEALGLTPKTLANRASVARALPSHLRREGVSFEHHAELAYLWSGDPKREPNILAWLDLVEKEKPTRDELREKLAEAGLRKGRVRLPAGGKSEPVEPPGEPLPDHLAQALRCAAFIDAKTALERLNSPAAFFAVYAYHYVPLLEHLGLSHVAAEQATEEGRPGSPSDGKLLRSVIFDVRRDAQLADVEGKGVCYAVRKDLFEELLRVAGVPGIASADVDTDDNPQGVLEPLTGQSSEGEQPELSGMPEPEPTTRPGAYDDGAVVA